MRLMRFEAGRCSHSTFYGAVCLVGFAVLEAFSPDAAYVDAAPAQVQASSTCAKVGCDIQLDRIGRVASPGIVDKLPTNSFFVVEEGDGGFLTISALRNQIVAFDAEGRAQVFGKDEPGQRVFISVVPAQSDSRAFLFDAVSGGMLRMAEDGTLGQGTPFPHTPFFSLTNGNFVVTEQIRSADLAGFPVHIVDPHGRVVRSFGMDVPEYRTDLRRVTTRLATPGSDETIWTIPPGRYVFEQWDPERGARLRQVTVQSSWFAESVRDDRDATVRPTPVILAAWESNGLLWALIRVADTEWAPPQQSTRERPLDPEEYDRRFDWMLEAIDPQSGNVLATRRFEHALWGRSSSSAVVATLIDGGRTRGIEVWRFSVRPK